MNSLAPIETMPGSHQIPKRPTVVPLQYLRAFAAVLVVIDHSGAQGGILFGFNREALSFGAIGVDIFFILSGFVMMLVSETSEAKPGMFIGKRLLRIMPVYWAAIAFYLVVDAVFGPFGFNRSLLATALSFVLWGTQAGDTVVGVAWTLRFEFTFYACFAAALFVSHRYRGHIAILLLLITTAALQFYQGQHSLLLQARNWHGGLYEFMFGIGIYSFWTGNRLFEEKTKIRQPFSFLLVLFVAVSSFAFLSLCNKNSLLYPSVYYKQLSWGLPAAFVFFSWLLIFSKGGVVGWMNQTLLHLGGASYSVYLVHLPVVAVMRTWPALQELWKGGGYWTFLVLATIASVAAGSTFYVLIERPLLNFLRNILARRKRLEV